MWHKQHIDLKIKEESLSNSDVGEAGKHVSEAGTVGDIKVKLGIHAWSYSVMYQQDFPV